MGIWNQHGLAWQISREGQRTDSGGLLSSAYFSAAWHDRHIFRCSSRGSLDKFGLGFGINTQPVPGGRSAGSISWAGIFNTFFWIDPSRKRCAVIMMQILPFGDDATNAVVEDFERAVYANSAGTSASGAGSN